MIASLLLATASLSVYMMMRSRRRIESIQRDFQELEGNASA